MTPEVSSNWSGYAAISTDPDAPAAFTDVTATWRVPKSTCTTDRISSAAFWVGLGGYDPASNSLEQLGTGADCDGSSKTPTYYAWWELVPAASVQDPADDQAPGDTISAAVLVNGQKISFSLKDLTRHTRFSKVLTATQDLDTASAEWIAEAPSDCSSSGVAGPCRSRTSAASRSRRSPRSATHIPGTLTDAAWTSDGDRVDLERQHRPLLRARRPAGRRRRRGAGRREHRRAHVLRQLAAESHARLSRLPLRA